jgi:hypothetical protein
MHNQVHNLLLLKVDQELVREIGYGSGANAFWDKSELRNAVSPRQWAGSQEVLLLPAAIVHLLRSKSVTIAQRVASPSHFSVNADLAPVVVKLNWLRFCIQASIFALTRSVSAYRYIDAV